MSSGLRVARFGPNANLAGRPHGVKYARHDLRRPGSVPDVGDLEFQQFGVGKSDAGLVVVLVKQHTQIGILRRRARARLR